MCHSLLSNYLKLHNNHLIYTYFYRSNQNNKRFSKCSQYKEKKGILLVFLTKDPRKVQEMLHYK